MSLRLRLASIWMPRFIMAREVQNIRARTDAALNELLTKHAPGSVKGSSEERAHDLEELRAAMAKEHERKVLALVDALGRDRAIALGREALYPVGVALGHEARERLGVGDARDLPRAAKVLYRILDIDVDMPDDPERGTVTVSRCGLSKHYSKEACMVMSAVDEGAVSGLCPGATMRFGGHITDPAPRCTARIEIKEAP